MRTHVMKNFDFNEEIMSDNIPFQNEALNSKLLGGIN